jgi:site-specific DNA-methyltransferase (adenine-specific)
MSERRDAGTPLNSERGPSGPSAKPTRAGNMSERREAGTPLNSERGPSGPSAKPTRAGNMSERRKTSTSNFGAGRRESHDARAFYERFEKPEITDDETVVAPYEIENPFQHGDARHMAAIKDGSVALVVTSPPYFAGKQYEEELERDGIPSSYAEYIGMLEAVFAECKRKLEPGGRIAVNVANLGRKPYRSLSADVIDILQNRLHLLLRGEVVWRKGEGSAGNCAWGSFRSAANPGLRDITERIVIASKGRFDRATNRAQRSRLGLPAQNTVDADEFMAATLDVWEIPPESARRVSHPAPFPIALPERLIRLYTYENDLVLDPFLGSGSTLVAASRLGRRYVGYDLDAQYCEIARRRVTDEGAPLADDADSGKAAAALAAEILGDAGFHDIETKVRIAPTGMTVSFAARDANDDRWYFDVSGAYTVTPNGLFRTENAWRAVGRAHALRAAAHRPYVLLTTRLPRPRTEGGRALRTGGPDAVFDAIELRSSAGLERLAKYASGGHTARPLPGFWDDRDIDAAD